MLALPATTAVAAERKSCHGLVALTRLELDVRGTSPRALLASQQAVAIWSPVPQVPVRLNLFQTLLPHLSSLSPLFVACHLVCRQLWDLCRGDPTRQQHGSKISVAPVIEIEQNGPRLMHVALSISNECFL